MDTNHDVPRIDGRNGADPVHGRVKWAPVKSLWFTGMVSTAVIGGYLWFTISGFVVFVLFTGITLCAGHSLGMHRRLIHNSFACPLWLEYLFVHFGVLVGLAGPLGMIRTHDTRDWAQRQTACHPYLRHGKRFWVDAWWQLHCELILDHPPRFQPEERVCQNKVYRVMEATWMMQQIPYALLLAYFGGISWVVWGICCRVSVSVIGHWLIGYFAHNCGHRDWHVEGAAVQGHNVKYFGLITMGECWHNNHHAYPGSALLGLNDYQLDPGWIVLKILEHCGLVWNVKRPEHFGVRRELRRIGKHPWPTSTHGMLNEETTTHKTSFEKNPRRDAA